MHQVSERKSKSRSIISLILREIIDFKGWEIIFKLLLIAFIGWGIFVLRIVFLVHTSPDFAHISKFHISDFTESIAYVPVFFLLRRLSEWICFHRVKRLLDPVKFPTEVECNERAKKACKWIMNTIYYTCSTAACYFLFNDSFFFPPMLGGSGSCPGLFTYMPGAPLIPFGQRFYMVQFACHLHTLIDHIAFKRGDSKFWEMFLHHGMSVFLIWFSYMSGEIAVGILVLFVHDPADIILDSGRLYNDLKVRKTAGVVIFYLSLLFVWIYTRLYAFPFCIIGEAVKAVIAKQENIRVIGHCYYYTIAMLISLFALHIYWFFMLVKIAINIAMKKKEFNSYDNGKLLKKLE
jgi:hypothetical protein